MAESSILWQTSTSGDGASTYTQDQATGWQRLLATPDGGVAMGVAKGYLSELAVSGSASPLSVASGGAVVYGFPYFNTASVSLAVTTPAIGTTGKRVVLQASWAAKTVRLAVISSADGTAAIPAVTQTASTTWEISLATFTITTGGVITLTDDRTYLRFAGVAIAGNIAANSIDKTKAGDGIVQFSDRSGGSASDWTTAGSSNYTPTAVRQEMGMAACTVTGGNVNSTTGVAFIQAFSNKPLLFLTIHRTSSGVGEIQATAHSAGITTTDFDIVLTRSNPASTAGDQTIDVAWMAIGPE